jgi:HK97 family phage major capsid protein
MPDVGRYSTEDAWMEACVPARLDEGMEQDQAVASCLQQWRDRNKAALGAERLRKSYSEVNRAYSRLEVKAIDDEHRSLKGIASTPSVDRVGDIVEPLGAQFVVPMPLMLDHDHKQQVGHVYFAKPTKAGIPFEARIVKFDEPGEVKDLVDKAWHLVKSKLRSFVSIGFKPLNDGLELMDNGGLRFTKWEWLETSLVSIPANREAVIFEAKSLDAAIHEVKSLDQGCPAAIGETAVQSSRAPRSGKSTGSIRIPQRKEREQMATYVEQIGNIENTLAAKKDRMGAIMQRSIDEGRSTDDSEQTEFDDLQSEVERLNADLKRLRVLDRMNLAEAKPITNGEVKSVEDGSNARGGYIHVTPPPAPPGIRFARLVKCMAIAKGNSVGAVQVAEQLYKDDQPVINILKAAIAAGSTTNQPWAGALVSAEGAVFAEFLEYLRPMTILGKFGQNGVPALRTVPFRVPIGSQTSGGAAQWVGEGVAKPLTYFEVARTTLEPLKVAAIVTVTEELLRYASMSAETWLRDQLVAALRERLDLDFIDPGVTAIPGTRPAAITNGVTPVTSAGSSGDAVRADIAAVVGNFIAANNLATQGVWIMDANTALRLSMMTGPLGEPQDFARGISMTGGTFAGLPAIVSEYVGEFAGSPGASNVWLVAADQIFLGDDGGFQVDMSRETSLLMDNAPVMSSGGVGSPDAPVGSAMVSMFQTNSVAFRAERIISWVKARASAVQGISNVQWGS